MSSSGSGGGGVSIPSELLALVPFGSKVQQLGLAGAVMSIVLPALLEIFVLEPLGYGIGFIEWAGAIVTEIFAGLQSSLADGLAPVPKAIVGSNGVVDIVYGSIESLLMDLGLGAPFVSALTAVALASVLTILIFLLIRISLDAIPGGGGLIP